MSNIVNSASWLLDCFAVAARSGTSWHPRREKAQAVLDSSQGVQWEIRGRD